MRPFICGRADLYVAISSVAYATGVCLATLILAGPGALDRVLPISAAIVLLLFIVALSYRQTIPAYPNGGGSYIVAKDNLGTLPGLTAAASLLIDYVLTVSVSVSSGVQTLASAFPALSPAVVVIDVAIVFLIMVVNLRGVRESGSIFAIPTYFFIFSALALIGVGLFKAYILSHQPFIAPFHPAPGTGGFPPIVEPLTIFLILKAFAAGCSAMTGVEAISNGIPAFQKPETRNAAIWPWLVQVGYHRAGWYTDSWYSWIDKYFFRIERPPSADHILPQFQHLAVGDTVPDGPVDTAFFTVAQLEPQRALALFSTTHILMMAPASMRNNLRLGLYGKFSWVFVLDEQATGVTRLIVRTRASCRPRLFRMLLLPLFYPGDFLIARMMLRAIRQRVERDSGRPQATEQVEITVGG